jgi:hypothetical protein
MLREIGAEIFDHIPAAALVLRAARFPAPSGELIGCDEFDERSLHIVFREGPAIAGYVRLTIGAPGVFRTWSRGTAKIPEGREVADLSRCCVNPAYRRLELLRSLCVEALIFAYERKLVYVNGTHVPGRFLATSLHDIGFRASGPCVESFEPNGKKIYQPLTCCLESSAGLWAAQQQLVANHLAVHGYSLYVDFHSASLR